jgi:hypothetical protein
MKKQFVKSLAYVGTRLLAMSAVVVLMSASCLKDLVDPKSDPNELGGDTNLELTKVGNVSTANLTVDGKALPNGSMTVTSSKDGIVVYKLSFNLKGNKDSATYAKLLPSQYWDSQGNVVMDFKFKITSEGIQDLFRRERPWTLVKYSDGVGTEYPFTTDNGVKQVRKITEKTGKDDWYMGGMLIKTTKIEQDLPESDQTAKKISYRANHKFGLVYTEVLLKTGSVVNLRITPKF